MDTLWLKFDALLLELQDENFLILCGLILAIFLLFFLYSFFRVKQGLHRVIYQNIQAFQKFFDSTNHAILILSSDNKMLYANKAMIALLDLKKGFEGKAWKNIPQIKEKDRWESLDKTVVNAKKILKSRALSLPKVLFKGLDNKVLSINLHLNRLLMGTHKKQYYTILTIHDLSLVDEVTHLAHRHKLSGLANQLQAEEDILSLFSKIHLQKKKLAFVLLGFDNYAMLRSIIGYDESNTVIIQFAEYLKHLLENMNIAVYHTFDNHFLLMITEVDSQETVTALIRDMQLRLAMLYKAENVSLHLTLSAGVALYPDSGDTRTLLDNTYHALAQAQTYGDGKIQVYKANQSKEAYDDLILHNDMEDALARGNFEVYYQPIVEVKGETVVAAEALIRWIHPKYGMIPPFHFIELMEKTGFIVRLGEFIVDEVFKQQKRWDSFGFRPIEVSINVSMVEIATGEYVDNIAEKLKEYALSPKRVKFEITEGMAMIGETQTEAYFSDLKDLGVAISLDDFGTGYTSFSYLKKFPADVLKIDKSLVDYIVTSVEDQRIVHAIIDLGHTLGMKIVVEGVETREMVDMLKGFGCDYIQGYYFSKPQPVLDFQKFIRPEDYK